MDAAMQPLAKALLLSVGVASLLRGIGMWRSGSPLVVAAIAGASALNIPVRAFFSTSWRPARASEAAFTGRRPFGKEPFHWRGPLAAADGEDAITDEAAGALAQAAAVDDLVSALVKAYDIDGDGFLRYEEVSALHADANDGQPFSSQAFDWLTNLRAGSSGDTGARLSKDDVVRYYSTRPEKLRQDFRTVFEPRIISMVLVGSAAVLTVQMSAALRRRLAVALGSSFKGQLQRDVGLGATRLREGWICVSGEPKTVQGNQEPFQFVDLRGKDNGLQAYATRNLTLTPRGAVTMTADESATPFDPRAELRATQAPVQFVPEGAVPPRPNISPVLERLLSFRFAAPSKEKDEDDPDDVSRAYKSVRDFQILQEGHPAYVQMDAFRGCADIKTRLEELVALLKDPGRYERLGAKPPKGVLLCGEPGTGKTFAARAIASAAGVSFLAISGSDFRQSPFSGVGTSMTLKMFDEAKKKAPCVVFIDEIDSLGEARRQGPTAFLDAGEMGGSVTRDQDANLNMLLAKMDGFQPSSGVLFLAATNRPEVLDEALIRAGRFDQRIEFKLPDAEGRKEILQGHAAPLKLAKDFKLDFADLAAKTPAFSPADLEALLQSGATTAARLGREAVAAEDIEASLLEARKRKAKARPEGAFQVIECVDTTFADVEAQDEAVQELKDVVDALVNREKYKTVGAVPPRGVLLDGPPGVGKTLCARALAGEVGLPFLSASGSDFQASRFAGQGTQLVKKLFAMAEKLQPCIVFIDEVDSLGRRRDAGARGAEQDRENTMMQLLVELDGFDSRSDILLVVATNRPDVLDPALLRPGRIDRRVTLELPDERGRESTLQLYTKDKPLEGDVDLGEFARRTQGFSGADIKNLVNEAALLAAKRDAKTIARQELVRATDRISLGMEKANPQLGRDARRLTAVHEAGHVVAGLAFAPATRRNVARASIRPRAGGIGGVTVFEPAEAEGAETWLPPGIHTRQGSLGSLCVDLGGRVAEETILQALEVSSGASSDLHNATSRAMAMASSWGLCDSMLSLNALGHGRSDATQREAEVAAGGVLAQALRSTRAVLASEAGRSGLEQVATKLLEFEEQDAEQLAAAVDVDALQAVAREEMKAWVEFSVPA